MGFFFKIWKYCSCKILGILFNYNFFTDVGCTFKLIQKKHLDLINNNLAIVKDSTFQPYLMILLILKGLKIIEIPVSYY